MNPDESVNKVKSPPEASVRVNALQPNGNTADLATAAQPATSEVTSGDSTKPKSVDPNLLTDVSQVRFKTIDGKLYLLLPTDKELQEKPEAKLEAKLESEESSFTTFSWTEMLEQLEQRMQASARFLKPRSHVYLQVGDRLLDVRQMQELAEALQVHELILHSIATYRRQTAINAAAAGFSVEQGAFSRDLPGVTAGSTAPLEDPLYVKMTVRSGTEIRHSGSVIVFGDVNAGGEIIADGDILVWGKLKGVAHAGAKGNAQTVIMALHLEATQLRIADFVARVDPPSTAFCPEVAHVSTVGVPSIRIVKAADHALLKN